MAPRLPMPRLASLRSEDGSVSIIMAASLMMLAGFSAVVIDAGLLHMTRRNLQAATDIAAMEAARLPANATARATTQLVNNGFPAGALQSAATGTWDATLAVGSRFTAGAAGNAVRVTSQVDVPLFFGRVVTGTAQAPVRVQATASHVPLGAFEIGSGLASLNAGLANQILGSLLGTTLSLDTVSYNGLLNSNVDALRFMDALATQVGLSAGTYGDLANTTVSVKNVIAATATVLGDATSASAASGAVATVTALASTMSSGPVIKVGELLNLGFWREQKVGSSQNATTMKGTASLNVYNLISMAGQIGSPNSLITLPTALNIPGVATGTIRMSLIQPMQSAPAAAVNDRQALGPVGIKAATAQVRLAIDLTLLDMHYLKAVPVLGPLLTSLVSINLPLYLDVAPAQGELTAVTCGNSPATDSSITVTTTTGIARLAVGSVTSSSLQAAGPMSLPTGATLVNVLNVIRITANASAQAGQGGPTPLTFNMTQIAAHTAQSVSSGKTLTTLLTTLTTSLGTAAPTGGLTVTLLGVAPINAGLVVAAVGNTVSPVLTALDPILDQTLRVLGVRVGYAEVRPLGVRCGIPALVN